MLRRIPRKYGSFDHTSKTSTSKSELCINATVWRFQLQLYRVRTAGYRW
jgi:hypothetical protein